MSESKGRIVVGVDGSEASLDALKWASAQAKLSGATLEAVISWVIPASYGVAFGGEDAIDWKENASRALEEALTAGLGEDTAHVQRRIEQGHPSYVLVEASQNADLVVVGSRGHGGFAGLVLGSVSSYVVSHSECPVTVTRHHKNPT